MGWWFYTRESGQSDLEHLRAELLESTSTEGSINPKTGKRMRLIDGASKRNSVFYGALEITEPGRDDLRPATFTIAIVCLIKRLRSIGGEPNFGYKSMQEDMLPLAGAQDCPERILRLLSPVEDCRFSANGARGARAWRAACWEAINVAKARPRVCTGDFVIFEQPLEFSDGQRSNCFLAEQPARNRYLALTPIVDGNDINGLALTGAFRCRLNSRANWSAYRVIPDPREETR
jgi:hypothetical protein